MQKVKIIKEKSKDSAFYYLLSWQVWLSLLSSYNLILKKSDAARHRIFNVNFLEELLHSVFFGKLGKFCAVFRNRFAQVVGCNL